MGTEAATKRIFFNFNSLTAEARDTAEPATYFLLISIAHTIPHQLKQISSFEMKKRD